MLKPIKKTLRKVDSHKTWLPIEGISLRVINPHHPKETIHEPLEQSKLKQEIDENFPVHLSNTVYHKVTGHPDNRILMQLCSISKSI